MKIFFLILIVFALCFGVFAQDVTEKPNLILTGIVKEITAQEINQNTNSASYLVFIKLNLTLENRSPVPIILFQSEPLINYASVKTETYLIDGTFIPILAQNDKFGTSSAMFSRDWKKIREELNQSKPPQKKTFIISPDEKINFESFVRLDIPKYFDAPYKAFQNQNLALLQKLSPLELYLDCETWTTLPLIVDGKSGELLKMEFGQKLQNKWKDYGHLWFEQIESELGLLQSR